MTKLREVPSLFELILDKFANIRNQMTAIIRSLNAESAHKKEVWIVEFFSGEWVSSNDFKGEYWTKEEAERAYSQATNGCTYRAVRKNDWKTMNEQEENPRFWCKTCFAVREFVNDKCKVCKKERR